MTGGSSLFFHNKVDKKGQLRNSMFTGGVYRYDILFKTIYIFSVERIYCRVHQVFDHLKIKILFPYKAMTSSSYTIHTTREKICIFYIF